MPLYLNNTNLDDISEAIAEASQGVVKAFQDKVQYTKQGSIKPEMIVEALGELVDIMYMVEIDQASCSLFSDINIPLPCELTESEDYRSLSTEEISELGQHCLSLLHTLCEWASKLELSRETQLLRAVSVILALWVVRHGGFLKTLETVVDTLAQMANKTRDEKVLKELSCVMGELINAVHQDIQSSKAGEDAYNAWRVLNINRGIIAARTRDLNTIDAVFEQLSKTIPEQAAEYFDSKSNAFTALSESIKAQQLLQRYHSNLNNRILH